MMRGCSSLLLEWGAEAPSALPDRGCGARGEEEFFEAIRGRFTMHDPDAAQLDETFQTMDVRIFRLCKMPADSCRPVGTGE
jgi:hypothetical protein